jgi:hypothetical protein
MKRIIGLSLASVGCIALVILASVQSTDAQSPDYLASYFASGAREVTISTRSGQQLALLQVPVGVELSVHLSKGEFTNPDKTTGEATFTGDVSIRTKPRSEVRAGTGLREQMMSAPLRLDVQDALVKVVQKK